ncbi:MAG: TIM barrel protein [Oceanipulchritudo sp.]
MKPAVNTVTLRSFAPEEIVTILKDNRIDAVEWAGDVHVPPGETGKAESVKALCEAKQITATSYGSYYQCDRGGQGNGPFQYDLGAEPALETAKALGVNALRVWGGRRGSEAASAAYRDEVADCLRELCDQAHSHGMTVHLEFHRNTLTDSAESAVALMEAVARDNLYSYWQPRHGVSVAENIADIETLGVRLSHVHVFHWNLLEDGTIERRPLSEGRHRWQAYFKAMDPLPGERYAMLEFVRNDELGQLSEDAAALHAMLGT